MPLDVGRALTPSLRVLAFVHDIDPVILEVFGPLKLRWYGLSYLMAFVSGFFLLRHLTRRGMWCVEESKIGDFMAMLAIFGVFFGGRLGYVLFYLIPAEGWKWLLVDPLKVIRVWDGGMASHGGILGVMAFTFYYARKNKVAWTAVGDGLCVVAPLGLMFGRLANFINGELYGRLAHGLAWGVKFPQSIDNLEENAFHAMQEEIYQRVPEFLPAMNHAETFAEAVRQSTVVKEIAGRYLEDRHPSQLYEALGEGGLLFALLWFLRVRYPKAPHGMLTGVFFIFYAIARVVVEQYREPDAALIGAMTKGQFYSLFMIVIGAAFLFRAARAK
jgi:phosphatidylglycerol:prolipoprotein diacylglycerol transferase